jgi:RNA polymerase sigma-70 factor, ECF subfamily
MTERARFERLAVGHMRASYHLAYSLLRQRSDAEDAVQDAYVRAYRAMHQLRNDDIKPWLLTIVRNVCYRRLQERRRASNIISLDEALTAQPGSAVLSEAIASHAPSPEQAVITASNEAVLTDLVDALPPIFREIIILREMEELSYGDIAAIIGAPIGTVMSRLSRARTELRKRMAKHSDQESSNAL